MAGSVFRRVDSRTGQQARTWTLVVSVRGRDGRRRQKWQGGFRTKREAEARLAEIVHDSNRRSYVEPTKLSVRDYLRQWLDGRDLRASTVAGYRSLIEKWVIPALGNVPLSQLQPADLNGIYATIRAAGRSGRTAQLVHTIIRKSLADAVKARQLGWNPADAAERPKGEPRDKTTWSPAEVKAFLAYVRDREDRMFPAFVLAAHTGMRRGEVLGLRWSDVDLETGRLQIVQTIITVDYQITTSKPKTKAGRRSIRLNPATVAVLKAWQKQQIEERLAWGEAYQDSGLVFAREDGSPIHPDRLSNAFDELVEASGLPRIRFHDLRHSHASHLLADGVHPKVVQERLGHSSYQITMDIYSHVIPALHEDAADRTAALYGD